MKTKTPFCKGKKQGHRFDNVGGLCLNGCGINQTELSYGTPEKIETAIKEEKPNLHTEFHYIAETMWLYYNKKESFGLFLGIIKRKGTQWGYRMLSKIRSYEYEENRNYPIRFLMKEAREAQDVKIGDELSVVSS